MPPNGTTDSNGVERTKCAISSISSLFFLIVATASISGEHSIGSEKFVICDQRNMLGNCSSIETDRRITHERMISLSSSSVHFVPFRISPL
ncbi:unnamed protein product [Brugia timori]|uniref:Uncharacterized protein n=1 Tax=Brugia timori TaxID=42155 RepID=A0A3P7T7C0_9BILA|nr:unnamed protein product [Brugia timori]